MTYELEGLKFSFSTTPLPPVGAHTIPGLTPALRNQYRADRVTLVNNDAGSCGQAYVNAATYGMQWAFSVVNKGCAIGNSSLWHEWGHLDGLCHDETNNAGCTPAFPYGNGYCDPLGYQQSPMTYGNPCNKPRRIFSNIDNTWTYGHVYGDATHDEARVQRWAMPIEANFYPPLWSVPAASGKPTIH
jgi:hypothetical protein